MFKKFLYLLFVFLLASLPSSAEKIPVKIAPIQVVSTHHDELEVGDWVKFEVAKDVYIDDKLYIKKNAEVVGVVDFVHQNGWGGDSAEIAFKKFRTTDVNGKKVEIDYPLVISGNSEMANNARQYHVGVLEAINFEHEILNKVKFATFIVRGSEIFIEPDSAVYNLFIER